MKTHTRTILTRVMVILFSVQASAQIPDFVKEEIQRRTDMGLNPSIVLGIYDDHGEHYFSTGTKHPGKIGKATSKTLYPLGSLGNTFTGLLTGKLIHEGHIKEETPLGTLVYPPLSLKDKQGREITILDVVTYQSGIKDGEAYNISPRATWDSLYEENNLKRIRPYKTGKTFMYSDWAMALLGEGLSENSGVPYPDLIRQELFTPLELAFHYIKKNTPNAALATTGDVQPDKDAGTHQEGSSQLWAGSMEALVSYGKIFLDPQPQWESTIETTTRTYLRDGNGVLCAMGWFKDQEDNLYHAGHYRGYNVFMAIDRKNGRVIALATNTGTADITDIGLYLLNEKMNPIYPYIEIPVKQDDLLKYTGHYINDAMGLELELSAEGAALQSISEADTLSLHYMGQDRFYYQGQKAHLSFETDENDQVVGVLLDKNGKKVMFIKMD
ncbi:serine hydrolase domain-containing protein [Robertkochia flava]|uniref:serine hydrolase domain-containing protein n=1 Tax=Robertkochia flava TaxID=3447986 RepID=UPI001CCC7806|nr:serine hydrolase domain-containing protein [Robertkochia marina]